MNCTKLFLSKKSITQGRIVLKKYSMGRNPKKEMRAIPGPREITSPIDTNYCNFWVKAHSDRFFV